MPEFAPDLTGLSIAEVLSRSPVSPLEARILTGHALGLNRVELITRSERQLTPDESRQLENLFNRRVAGEPIAYLVGQREFYGLMMEVTPAVLIPRPETELLVDIAAEKLPRDGSVLDLGTGSGAIAVALACTRRDAAVSATDISPDALRVAQRNADRHTATVRLCQSDWYSALSGKCFNLIVTNPPYIASGDPHLAQGDLRFEPPGALTDHADGLSALRAIVTGAPHHLVRSGWLLMEHGYDQGEAVRTQLTTAGFSAVRSWQDLAGIDRVSGGQFE